jgi:hypothetical protein
VRQVHAGAAGGAGGGNQLETQGHTLILSKDILNV